MAAPLRFRRSDDRWTASRVRSALLEELDSNIGASMRGPWFRGPDGFESRRFEMDNGDVALFTWNERVGYWIGNTETPKVLWRTDKYTFDEIPDPVASWAERELLAQLHEEAPWLASYPAISRFFLPVLLSKDGRHTAREYLHDHAGGFPDASTDQGLSFFESFLREDAFPDDYEMASKLGTATAVDVGRMNSAMSEFTVAKLLCDAGYEVTPEVEVTTGHFIDFSASRADGESALVEVTRPRPPHRRTASSAVSALRETAETKTNGQLQRHGGGVTLFVDCSSFPEADWAAIADAKPSVNHRPAVVFRARPDGRFDGYTKGRVPVELPDGFQYR